MKWFFHKAWADEKSTGRIVSVGLAAATVNHNRSKCWLAMLVLFPVWPKFAAGLSVALALDGGWTRNGEPIRGFCRAIDEEGKWTNLSFVAGRFRLGIVRRRNP